MSDNDKRFDPQKRHKLLTGERQARWNPPQFLQRMAIQPGQDSPPNSHRVWPDDVKRDLEQAGFAQVAEAWHDDDAYLITAVKEASRA
jgi:hypothetical protein